MAGYENIRDANNKRTPEERRELAKKAGQASGRARRRKADFRKTLNLLLTAEIDNEEWKPVLESLGIECTLESALLMAQIKEAMAGNTKAAYLWHSMPDRTHRLLPTMQSRNVGQREWQRIPRKSAEAQAIANMRMKE